jgi:hypothetical protein
VNYLLIEDAQDKIEAIRAFINSVDQGATIENVDNLADARMHFDETV